MVEYRVDSCYLCWIETRERLGVKYGLASIPVGAERTRVLNNIYALGHDKSTKMCAVFCVNYEENCVCVDHLLIAALKAKELADEKTS